LRPELVGSPCTVRIAKVREVVGKINHPGNMQIDDVKNCTPFDEEALYFF